MTLKINNLCAAGDIFQFLYLKIAHIGNKSMEADAGWKHLFHHIRSGEHRGQYILLPIRLSIYLSHLSLESEMESKKNWRQLVALYLFTAFRVYDLRSALVIPCVRFVGEHTSPLDIAFAAVAPTKMCLSQSHPHLPHVMPKITINNC